MGKVDLDQNMTTSALDWNRVAGWRGVVVTLTLLVASVLMATTAFAQAEGSAHWRPVDIGQQTDYEQIVAEQYGRWTNSGANFVQMDDSQDALCAAGDLGCPCGWPCWIALVGGKVEGGGKISRFFPILSFFGIIPKTLPPLPPCHPWTVSIRDHFNLL